MLNRIAHRLKYTMGSAFFAGIIMVFFKEHRTLGFYLVVIGLVSYFFFSWLSEKTDPKHTYEADENGNAKPNYR